MCDIWIVRHNNNRLTFPVQVTEDLHDLDTGLAVKIPGRLITEKDFRIVDQCPCDGHTLLLPPESWLGRWALMSASMPTALR